MNDFINYHKSTRPLSLLDMTEDTVKRVAHISREFSEGFNFLSNYPRSVTIFGSTQSKPESEEYKNAERLAGRICKELHYSVITGGGPGIMEAANKGAYEAGGNSIGLTIELPAGQITNKYLTETIEFHYFFSRKVCLAFSAEAYIFFPGGFGTLDEFFEIVTLVQTGKVKPIPIILVGSEYWKPLVLFFNETLLKESRIGDKDINLYTVTDDEDKIIETIRSAPIEM